MQRHFLPRSADVDLASRRDSRHATTAWMASSHAHWVALSHALLSCTVLLCPVLFYVHLSRVISRGLFVMIGEHGLVTARLAISMLGMIDTLSTLPSNLW
jgi:hypothetical protein